MYISSFNFLFSTYQITLIHFLYYYLESNISKSFTSLCQFKKTYYPQDLFALNLIINLKFISYIIYF